MYCHKHCCFWNGTKCEKCVAGDGPYLRCRNEVADPKEWAKYVKWGWVR